MFLTLAGRSDLILSLSQGQKPRESGSSAGMHFERAGRVFLSHAQNTSFTTLISVRRRIASFIHSPSLLFHTAFCYLDHALRSNPAGWGSSRDKAGHHRACFHHQEMRPTLASSASVARGDSCPLFLRSRILQLVPGPLHSYNLPFTALRICCFHSTPYRRHLFQKTEPGNPK